METRIINLKESPVSGNQILDITILINNCEYSGLVIKKESNIEVEI